MTEQTSPETGHVAPDGGPAAGGVVDVPGTPEELRTWLAALPAIPRARLLRLITDGTIQPELVALRHAAVAEAAQSTPVPEVAEALGGISKQAVYSAIRRHKAATAAGE